MYDYGKIYNKAGDIAVKICFYGWFAALTYWVFAATPHPWDFTIIVPLLLAWFVGMVLILLFGFIPAVMISVGFGSLFAGLAYLKHKIIK